MTISKIVALNKGNPTNSDGAKVATSVNKIIDKIGTDDLIIKAEAVQLKGIAQTVGAPTGFGDLKTVINALSTAADNLDGRAEALESFQTGIEDGSGTIGGVSAQDIADLRSDLSATGGAANVNFGTVGDIENATGSDVASAVSALVDVSNARGGGIVHASVFGIVGDGSNQAAKFATALATGKRIDITGLGQIKISSEVPAPLGLRIMSTDETSAIVGYDGTGFRVSGGDISLEGMGIFGFYDGTDQNKTNYATCAVRVSAGTALGKVVLNNVRGNNNRSIIIAGNESNDFMPDITISTELIKVIKCDIRNTAMPMNWRGLCERDVCVGNEYRNIIGAGRIVAAHKVFLDGIAYDSPYYKECENHLFAHNYVHTVVNRTTTGNSTAGNNYECHALMVSGENVHAHDNTVIDCTGNIYDTEGFYIKALYPNVHDNLLVDAGTDEAAINLKGVNRDGSTSDTSPFGDRGKCHSNIIVFTRYEYMNGETLVDLTGRLCGIHVTAPNFFDVTYNRIYGADANDIRINGWPSSANESCHVTYNKSYGFRGSDSISWRGAFQNSSSCYNEVIDPVLPSSLSLFFHTRWLSVDNRGVKHVNTECICNKLVADVSDGRFNGETLSLIGYDLEYYDFEGIKTGGNVFDVKFGSATPSLRVHYVTSQTSSPDGTISGLVAEPDIVRNNLNTSPWFWGNNRITDYSIAIEVDSLINNINVTVAQFPTISGRTLSIEAKTDFSYITDGQNGTRWRIGTFYNNAGVATLQNEAAIYSYRAASAGDQALGVDTIYGRVRLLNNLVSDMKAKSRIKATCI